MTHNRALYKRRGLLAAAGAAAFAAALAATPACAYAAQIAHAEDNSATYDSVEKAWDAAKSGKTIVMDADWDTGTVPLILRKGNSATIKMNGHVIAASHSKVAREGVVFFLATNASLTLEGDASANRSFSYKGYNKDGEQSTQTITSGGLVTGGFASERAGAIYADSNCKLTLKNVALAGNKSTTSDAGGVRLGNNCVLTLENSKIEHNTSERNYFTENGGRGGGVCVDGDDTTVKLDASSISYNRAGSEGGGIASNGSSTTIELKNGSKIDNNVTLKDGGGIWFNYSKFKVLGDGNASVSHNTASKDSGGIHIEHRYWGTNEGKIDKIKIDGNTAKAGNFGGGGILCEQENVTISNCTITNNRAIAGGGIYIYNDDNMVSDCTITGNVCTQYLSSGGGINVPSSYDLNIGGKLVVKGNYFEKDGTQTASDVQLGASDMILYTQRAYLIGTVDKGSSIGVNTNEYTSNFFIAKKMNSYHEGTFFLNKTSGYYFSYGSKELRCVKGDPRFLLTVNDVNLGRYESGSKVIFTAAHLSADSSPFWRWDLDNSTGLSPIESIITDVYNPGVTFTFAQNDVHLKALYVQSVTKGIIKLPVPYAGNELGTSAEFTRNDGGAGGSYASSAVTWYEVADDGTKTAVAGKAQPGTTYVASIAVKEDDQSQLHFSKDMSAKDIAFIADFEESIQAASASVDSATGTLTVETTPYATSGQKPTVAAEQKEVSIILMDNGILAGSDGASDLVGGRIAAGTAADESAASDVRVNVYADADGSSTICAPVREGYNFVRWENVPDGVSSDDEAGTVTLLNPADGIELTALYAPKAVEVDLGMDAPQAGKTLATALDSLKVTSTDGQVVDFKKEFAETSDFSVAWSPAGADGKAEYRTAYTASIALDDGTDYVGVEDVLAQNATIKLNGTELDGATAVFVIQGGKLCLNVTFPTTGEPVAKQVTQPVSAQVSYELASELVASGSSSTSAWSLPKSTALTTANGEVVEVGIDWDVPAGFSANATGTQKLTATGTVEVPEWLDAADVSTEVTATVKVAAPADKAAAKAVTGKTVTVKASKKSGKTVKAKSMTIKAPASSVGTAAKFKTVSKSAKVKVNTKTGKVTLKKNAAKGKTYKAKVKVSYGKFSKTVMVKFKVK